MGIDGNLPLPPEVLAAAEQGGPPQYFLGIEGSANKVSIAPRIVSHPTLPQPNPTPFSLYSLDNTRWASASCGTGCRYRRGRRST